MELRDALTNAKAFLAKQEAKRAEIDAKIARVKDEIKGLELAMARLNGHAAKDTALPRTRPAAILRILGGHPKGLSPAEIARELTKAGRPDDPKPVSATLSVLRRRGMVQSAGKGRWVINNGGGTLPLEGRGPVS